MRCLDFERRLNAQLDERMRPQSDADLAAHAAGCERCRRLLLAQEKLFVGLSRMTAPPLGRDFARGVVAKASLRPSATVVSRAPLVVAACLGSAAAVLLALWTAWHSRSDLGGIGKMAAAVPAITARHGNSTLAIGQAQGNRPSVAGGDWLIEAPRLPGRLRNYRGAIDELALALPEAAQRLDEMEQIAPGIRPLRAALSIVWDTLCRTLPGARVDSPRPTRENTSLWWFEQMRVA
jgi:hypothetical protein